MDANERQLVGYKRKRNEEEEEEEEEEIIMFVVLLVVLSVGRNYMPLTREPYSEHFEYRIRRRQEWLKELLSQPLCVEQLRIRPESFDNLCNILQTKGGLVASKHVTVKEIVALFLHILSHCIRNRTIKATYIRSGETISRQFHKVLRAVLAIGSDYIKERPQVLSSGIAENWKWFQGSLGALDGTYIPLTVPTEDECRFRSRKGHISTNVLGVCDPNLRFTYVLPGWEGSASDSRVLRDALSRTNGLKVPRNNYYLVDAGYTNGPGFLAPYRSTRYHLNLWRGNTPRNYKELFNHRHSMARSTIERAFGLLKKRWGILRTAGFYDVKTQVFGTLDSTILTEMNNKGQVIPSQSRRYVQWNDDMDEVLTQVLLDQANQGNKADGDWKAQAYQAVVDQVRITLGNILTKDNVRNRLRQWKKQYAVISDIQNRSGVSFWDEEKKKVVVTTENATDWQNYLKINPNASSYANKEIKNWDNVVLLCGKDRAVGSHVENFQDAAGAMAREEDDTRSNSSFESVSVEGTKAKRSGEGSSNSNKRSKKDQVGDSLMMVANTLQSYYESKKKKEESRHSTKEIYEVLCNISGLSRTEIAKAVIKYNNSDPGQFNLLLDIPMEERKLFVECFLSES